MRREGNLCIWCFDLLAYGDQDIRAKPLVERKAKLRDIVTQTDDDRLRYSEGFRGPCEAAARLRTDGIGGSGVKAKEHALPHFAWGLGEGENQSLARGKLVPLGANSEAREGRGLSQRPTSLCSAMFRVISSCSTSNLSVRALASRLQHVGSR